MLHKTKLSRTFTVEMEETMMKLYTYFRSSAAFRVRMALNIKGIAYEPHIVWLPDGQQKSDAYRQINPQNLVPTLIDDGEQLNQSMAIIEYLDETHPEPALMPKDPLARAHVRSLSQLIACDIHPINNLRVLKYLKGELKQEQSAIDNWYRHWCDEGLAAYERQLAESNTQGRYSFGNTVTMADLCLVPQIFNAKRFEVDLTKFPATMAIFDRLMLIPAIDIAQPSKQPDAQ
jgi:maleylpyruvate isomerase